MKQKQLYTIEEVDRQANWTSEQIRRINKSVKFKLIAYKLKEIRFNKNLTQQQLAEKAGIPRSVIARIETGKKNITVKTLMDIAESLGEEVQITFVKKQK